MPAASPLEQNRVGITLSETPWMSLRAVTERIVCSGARSMSAPMLNASNTSSAISTYDKSQTSAPRTRRFFITSVPSLPEARLSPSTARKGFLTSLSTCFRASARGDQDGGFRRVVPLKTGRAASMASFLRRMKNAGASMRPAMGYDYIAIRQRRFPESSR
ncbi:MAG: hypothetical protein II933_04935 [Candidatus Methanomethylophilaceae archaeon]|nr:hypothetical protein [Candidatus Methanomethylophilaceae archaeon]